MKEEEKHSSPVISSRNPSCNLRNQNSSFWEVPHSVCGGGAALFTPHGAVQRLLPRPLSQGWTWGFELKIPVTPDKLFSSGPLLAVET